MRALLAVCLLAVPLAVAFAQPGPAARPGEGQSSRGASAFWQYCSSCHGSRGEGKHHVGPPLIGPHALPVDPRPRSKYRNNQFRTAQDLASFVMAKMPPGLRAKPSCDEYWAIVAHLLTANRIAHPEPLGPSNASTVSLAR